MLRLTFLAILLVLPNASYALSAAGHEAVCRIAYKYLSPEAREKIDLIIETEPDERFKTFHDSCVWPDIRGAGAIHERKKDHYINVPRTWSYIGYERCVENTRCLFSAIRYDESILRNSNSDQEKLKSLKYLGHWLGDIHQPLHVSFSDDRGGNEIYLEHGIGCKKNMHSVWDQCIPEDIMKSLGLDPSNTDSRKDFGDKLYELIPADKKEEWASETRLVKWAGESFKIARQAEVRYCFLDGRKCQYSREELMHHEHGEGINTRTVELTGAYEDQFSETMTVRMQKAGLRLGYLLNDIFR